MPYVDCAATRVVSAFCAGGVNGDELFEFDVAKLVVRVRGDGVSGIRPPAVLEENRP